MNKSTKILAGIATIIALAGAGTATYFGIKNSELQARHDAYVQESETKIKELEQQNYELFLKLLEYEPIEIPPSSIHPPPTEIPSDLEESSNNDTNESLNENLDE